MLLRRCCMFCLSSMFVTVAWLFGLCGLPAHGARLGVLSLRQRLNRSLVHILQAIFHCIVRVFWTWRQFCTYFYLTARGCHGYSVRLLIGWITHSDVIDDGAVWSRDRSVLLPKTRHHRTALWLLSACFQQSVLIIYVAQKMFVVASCMCAIT